MQIFVLQMKVVMLTDGETGHQQIVITDGRIVSGPRVRIQRSLKISVSDSVVDPDQDPGGQK
jgi:hypothetical protein